MSATRTENSTNAVANQEGQIGSHVPRSEPLTTHGHKPGVIASKADAAPEFRAQTLPAGTAPPSSTFTPNPDTIDPTATTTSASDTLQGDTSADVHTGLGHPGQGQTSTELHHAGTSGGSKNRSGLEGIGATGDNAKADDPAFSTHKGPDAQRGNLSGLSAEEKIPESAETVASEAPTSGTEKSILTSSKN